MSVQVMDEGRQRTLPEHIAAAQVLEAEEVKAIAGLAAQLHGRNVLPVIGAGASFDCGMRLASEIAPELHAAYKGSADLAPHDEALDPADLAEVAEAIFLHSTQSRVVSELGLPDPEVWRPAEAMGEHFCVYCVLARMVREGFLAEAFGFNYDCGAEAGLSAEGFARGGIVGGRRWLDRARIVADGATNADTKRDASSFTLFKANGCAVRYRELAANDEETAAEGIVIRRDQLDKWQESAWSRDRFRERVQDHLLLLVGFSAQDSKFSTELRGVLENVYRETGSDGTPRVVAIDKARNATAIEGLIRAGLDGRQPAEGAVTQVCSDGSTATAVLLVLLADLLAIALNEELEEAGVVLPVELEDRLAMLAISVPTMLRWSYLARAPRQEELIQRANQIAQRGYVPLGDDPAMSARLIQVRRRLCERLGRLRSESSSEVLADHGFLVDAANGVAYMPVGIEVEELQRSCRPGAELERVRAALAGQYPAHLECILLAGDGEVLHGVNLATGARVGDG